MLKIIIVIKNKIIIIFVIILTFVGSPKAAGASHDSPRAQTCTFRVPAFKTSPEFNEKNPERGKKELILWREREKKREILGGPAEGGQAKGGPGEGGPWGRAVPGEGGPGREQKKERKKKTKKKEEEKHK